MTCDVGVIGLATMGSNLALNIGDRKNIKNGDKKFEVAVFNRTFATTQSFLSNNANTHPNIHGFETMHAFKDSLKKPRIALILVKAGVPTDATIKQLEEVFEEGDIIVDTGNAHFRDQTRRAAELEGKKLRFLGMGISGGEEGARKGPAFFPGGTLSVWNDIKHIIEAASAKAEDGRPCAVMNGKGGAGSCVKMFHNAGEYAILQIWGEVVAVMRAWKVEAHKQAEILNSWKTKNDKLLSSYMLDITAEVVQAPDSEEAGGSDDGTYLIYLTKDTVGSKGTGLWSVQEALGAGVPAPSLAAAVLARQMTMYKSERIANGKYVKLPKGQSQTYSDEDMDDLYWTAALSIIASYAQMFQCLRELDKQFDFGLNLPATIATFRAGCILQGQLLKPMTKAFEDNPDLSNLMAAFSKEITENVPRMKRVIGKVVEHGSAAIPVITSSLGYIHTMHDVAIASGQCVALQRDVFGRHGFKRLDKEGDFNAKWPELQ